MRRRHARLLANRRRRARYARALRRLADIIRAGQWAEAQGQRPYWSMRQAHLGALDALDCAVRAFIEGA